MATHDDPRYSTSERAYHQSFIHSADHLPAAMKSRDDNSVFVWAHELPIHSAGAGTGIGKLDLGTIDEGGQVWLIEAKCFGNPTLSANLWRGQIARYRKHIQRMDWDLVHRYTRSFICGTQLSAQPQYTDTLRGCQNLLEAVRRWQDTSGRRVMSPERIVDTLAASLKQGSFGLAVLADEFRPDVVAGGEAFEHTGPLAYAVGLPRDEGLSFSLRWHRANGVSLKVDIPHVDQTDYNDYEAAKSIPCTPDTLAETLCPAAADLWENVLMPGLGEAGWSGAFKRNKKSFAVQLPIHGKLTSFVAVGWSDTDAKSDDVPEEFKEPYNYGMKVNWNLYSCAKETFVQDRDFVESWARRFQACGWKFKGTARMQMNYNPAPGIEDFCEWPRQEADLRGFLEVLREFVEALSAR